jgi:fatty acid desaturase
VESAVETATGPAAPPSAQAPPVDHAKLEQAKRRLAAIKGFYIHLAVFVLVLAGLLAVNLATGRDWWVHWVVLGWGIGVVAHAVAVFGGASRAVAEWERRKLRQLMHER